MDQPKEGLVVGTIHGCAHFFQSPCSLNRWGSPAPGKEGRAAGKDRQRSGASSQCCVSGLLKRIDVSYAELTILQHLLSVSIKYMSEKK